MADKKITAKDLEGWYAPQQVRELAEKSGLSEQAAVETVWGLVTGGLIRCVATHWSALSPDNKITPRKDPVEIASNNWPGITDDSRYDFWSGRLQIRYLEDTSFAHRSRFTTISLFGIKLDPAHVHEHFPKPNHTIVAAVQKIDRKGWPQPSPVHLEAWFKVFRAAYPKGSEDDAIESAEGMFRDKWIVRKRIRDLMGPGKMGRPSKED
jgi:hypothetical protein